MTYPKFYPICCLAISLVSSVKAQQVAQLSSDPQSGRLVFSLNAPIALNVSRDFENGATIGFILRDIYSEANGTAVELFTNVFTGEGSENTLRVYVPKENHTSSTNYGTWGTRANTGGDVTARDFFGSVTLNDVDLQAGDQVFLLPGKVTLSANAATLLPDVLNDSTQFEFFSLSNSASLSVRAGLGAITTPLPKNTMSISFSPTQIIVNWTGPGLLERSKDLGQSDPWFRETTLDALSPPRTFFRSELRRSDSFYFRLAAPWNEITQP